MTQNVNNVNAHKKKNGYSGIQPYSLIPLLYVGKKERKDGSSLGRIASASSDTEISGLPAGFAVSLCRVTGSLAVTDRDSL